jgi:hypothetical protein
MQGLRPDIDLHAIPQQAPVGIQTKRAKMKGFDGDSHHNQPQDLTLF